MSVSDADAAIAYGPGLRWALMGPRLIFHLAGGEGGMPHFMSHLGPAMQSWMDDLGDTRLTPQVQKQIIDGVAEEAGQRTIADLQTLARPQADRHFESGGRRVNRRARRVG